MYKKTFLRGLLTGKSQMRQWEKGRTDTGVQQNFGYARITIGLFAWNIKLVRGNLQKVNRIQQEGE